MATKANVPRLMAEVASKSLRIVRDIHCAADVPQENWSYRRRKVVQDAQLSTADAPFYLKAATIFAANAIKAEQDRVAPRMLGIVIGVPIVSKEEWLRLSAESQEAPALAVIDVEVEKK